MDKQSLAIVWRHAPYGQCSGQESLDLALVCSALELSISLFFLDDGVLQLIADQDPKVLAMKATTALFASCDYYDLKEAFYVCSDALLARGIQPKHLLRSCQILPPQKLSEQLYSHQHIINL